mgnify:CR=1 FL=1
MLYTSVDKLTVSNQVYKFMCDLYPNLEKVDIYFSLAKAEEDIGNIENASEYLIYGNKLNYFERASVAFMNPTELKTFIHKINK